MLHQIFQVTGTPNADSWAAALTLPYFRASFPKWSPKPLSEVCCLRRLLPHARALAQDPLAARHAAVVQLHGSSMQ
jgi:hypothetical protein